MTFHAALTSLIWLGPLVKTFLMPVMLEKKCQGDDVTHYIQYIKCYSQPIIIDTTRMFLWA